MKSKKLNTKNKILVLGGSKGIGKSISDLVKKNYKQVKSFSSKDVDTSDLSSVKKFVKNNKSTDVIVLNSGGPPNLKFEKINEKIWYKYFNQLFLGFTLILKNIKINNNGYIFYISSSVIREPGSSLLISSSLRIAFNSLLKSLSKEYSKKNISVISIAPGPFKTGRVKELIPNLKEFEKKLPTKKIGDPQEIAKLVNFIIQNKLKYLTGTTIYMDGNTLNTLVWFIFTVQKLNAISVQLLNSMNNNLDHFNVLRKIRENPNSSQRELASKLGFSLGKLNYCLKALKDKGLIKISNFQKNPNKFGYAYILTPKGISTKTKLTLNFMKRKMNEYDELKKEIKNEKGSYVDNSKSW